MNVIEQMFINAANRIVQQQDRLNPEENKLANEEALAVLKQLDASKLAGLLVMGVQYVKNEQGEEGIELISTMVGSPLLLRHLASGVPVFLKMNDLMELHRAAGIPVEDPFIRDSAMNGGKVQGRYDVPEDATKQ